MGIERCHIITFPKIEDVRGNLTFIENEAHIPFEIKRVYYIYDVPGGAERAGHAHRNLHQVFIAMSGSFDIVLDDGHAEHSFHLARSNYGLYVCPMIWRVVRNFSGNSVLLVLASDYYREDDYYRDYDAFRAAARAGG